MDIGLFALESRHGPAPNCSPNASMICRPSMPTVDDEFTTFVVIARHLQGLCGGLFASTPSPLLLLADQFLRGGHHLNQSQRLLQMFPDISERVSRKMIPGLPPSQEEQGCKDFVGMARK